MRVSSSRRTVGLDRTTSTHRHRGRLQWSSAAAIASSEPMPLAFRFRAARSASTSSRCPSRWRPRPSSRRLYAGTTRSTSASPAPCRRPGSSAARRCWRCSMSHWRPGASSCAGAAARWKSFPPAGRPASCRCAGVPDLTGEPGARAQAIPLRWISAAEMQAILTAVAPRDVVLRVDRTRNMLILSGDQA